MSPHYIGSPNPSLILYLPNPPLRESIEQPVDVPELIALNGNHWRKIFTILAKLCGPAASWKQYRDHDLLKQKEAISFGDSLIPVNARHIVAGKASWGRLGLDQLDFDSLDDQQRVWKKGNVFLTPYPDYRQFPNELIEQLKHFIS
ncbi:MAG: hypothetical protein OQK12_10280 [Motiliproteus sp.]|nr:hypothetical protein [Motiliproteus sp.]MCW9051488.1 hypothetical protein [Motiliproteus sp.]